MIKLLVPGTWLIAVAAELESKPHALETVPLTKVVSQFHEVKLSGSQTGLTVGRNYPATQHGYIVFTRHAALPAFPCSSAVTFQAQALFLSGALNDHPPLQRTSAEKSLNMATEVAAVETPEVVEDRTEEKAAEPVEEGYDASLLVFVKGKAKRPARPDDAERNIQVQKLQEQIDKASARITEIKAILDSRGSSRGVVSPEVQAGRDKIQQLRAEFDTVLVRGHLTATTVQLLRWLSEWVSNVDWLILQQKVSCMLWLAPWGIGVIKPSSSCSTTCNCYPTWVPWLTRVFACAGMTGAEEALDVTER